jgi:cation transport ATPase
MNSMPRYETIIPVPRIIPDRLQLIHFKDKLAIFQKDPPFLVLESKQESKNTKKERKRKKKRKKEKRGKKKKKRKEKKEKKRKVRKKEKERKKERIRKEKKEKTYVVSAFHLQNLLFRAVNNFKNSVQQLPDALFFGRNKMLRTVFVWISLAHVLIQFLDPEWGGFDDQTAVIP